MENRFSVLNGSTEKEMQARAQFMEMFTSGGVFPTPSG